MPTYFISRHIGAVKWAEAQVFTVNRHLAHLDINLIEQGDRVIGSLPVNLAAEVCQKGAGYIHLSLTLPEQWRGMELTASQMNLCEAKLERYTVAKCDD
ncbi:MAG: CRISPR-associated protein Csx16 [Methylicorpusculum sp.]|uniref:CRISPR-associated protein Csx16 n=1 Tax=Methylicorpusculum sp. TaxID=2713644 RepID=UPI00271E63FF|nr:CRISPR-associated protein Csx16 [Methylicorpusculum sp.]MDO8844630.1 CRISPR-associated protein Csx16 [Methylicorpusculum sp.]MDO8940718.1 CRISPR-associated protein Csx16 [Methylicorpusculum sp.]MDP2203777.1 CRISPR-associated protein Csx16 [Methylicorpusculum sp.]